MHSFWLAVRNPLYCGKIFVPKYKDEESFYVKGQHEAIISEALYYTVQDVLDGRRKISRPKVETIEELPLRGFLICPKCAKILSGSKSKGRNRYYSYYHCFGGCTHRFRAESVNEQFINELQKYLPRPEYTKLYTVLIAEAYKEQTKGIQGEKRQLLAQIKDYENRLSKARELVVTNQIDSSDYREMKSDYGGMVTKLEAKLSGIINEKEDIEGLLNQGIDNLLRLSTSYEGGTFVECRGLIGSIYPENLTFNGTGFRTTRINEAVQLIYLINNEIDGNKKGTKKNISSLSLVVGNEGFEPPTPSV